ncbi:hypothetical protein L249_7090 [Ophiocordyceps polyrhachis-furcata BCC 54312]|uniref:Uncharacterized protein n=1 Tax=Ophiocordyceps polyrhachis-furcata BCC 54312 TaxID=1330021 RepID=A0A367LLA1_9HYPO|nr:hypothetical protein L249_7090 [Ophiocordyceps polyrhachis-furcata BCC 54312]
MKLKLIMNWNTMTWLYVTTFRLFVGRYDRYWYSASIAYSAPIDVQRADRCDDRCNESIGRYDRYSPTVTQGVVAGLRSNWYNLFQVALQAYFLSV